MRLFFLPLLFVVPVVALAMTVFVVGAFLLRVLFYLAVAAAVGAVLFGTGLLGKIWRALGAGAQRVYWRYQNRRFAEPRRQGEPDNSAFDEYRRTTLIKLDTEAQEFRVFLAKLRQAADAADFQAFLNSRRAGF